MTEPAQKYESGIKSLKDMDPSLGAKVELVLAHSLGGRASAGYELQSSVRGLVRQVAYNAADTSADSADFLAVEPAGAVGGEGGRKRQKKRASTSASSLADAHNE